MLGDTLVGERRAGGTARANQDNRVRRAVFCVAPAIAAVLGLVASIAQATEGGGSAYPYGLNTVATGILPKPGHYLYMYNSFYEADVLKDNDGDAAPLPFDVNVRVHTLRYLGVHPSARLFGGSVGWLVAQPFLVGDVTIGPREAYDTGFGDAALGLMLGWRAGPRHSIAGIDLHVPNGSYDQRAVFSQGRNYWATTLYYSITQAFGGRFDANLRTNLTLNDVNPDTHYHSGHEMGADFSLNGRIAPQAFVGLNGYYHQQITDDEMHGQRVPVDGRRVRALAMGPQVGYRGKGWGITAKWQHETIARNKAEGDKYWLQLFVAL